MSESAILKLLAVVGLVLLALMALLVLVGVVAADGVLATDRQVYLAVRGAGPRPAGPQLLVEIIRDVTALGSNTIVAIVVGVAVMCLYLGGRRREAAFVVVTVASGAVVVALLKTMIARPRPDLFEHAHQVFTLSFPSGHASKSALVYLTLAVVTASIARTRGIRVVAVTVALLLMLAVGFSRVYLGVHWPTDVLAGWLVGTVWVLGTRALYGRLAPERTAGRVTSDE